MATRQFGTPFNTVVGVGTAIRHPVDTFNAIKDDYAKKSQTPQGQGEIAFEIASLAAPAGWAAKAKYGQELKVAQEAAKAAEAIPRRKEPRNFGLPRWPRMLSLRKRLPKRQPRMRLARNAAKEPVPKVADRVYPSGERNGRPLGRRLTNLPNADSSFKRGIEFENRSADEIARDGYRIEQNPVPPTGSRAHPDFRIEGKYFDNYAPKASTSAATIVNEINQKVATQAERIVLNLGESNVTRSELREALRLYGSSNLKELIVIDKSGNIIRFFP